MSVTEKPIIPSTEGVIDLTTLETSVEMPGEESIQKELADALAGKTVVDDPLNLKVEKVEIPLEEEEKEIIPPKVEKTPTQPIDGMLASLKLILGEDTTSIIQQNDDGEDVEVLLEDLELTPTILAEIISAKHQMDLEESKKDSISTKGVSELGKSLLEIDKRGGDITELLRVKQAISDPIENLDLDTVAGQKQAITIRLQASNTPQEDIDLFIGAYEANGKLEEKANIYANELREYFKNLVKEKQDQTIQEEKRRGDLIKDFTKDLKTAVASSFELKPAVQDRIVKAATKKTANDTYEVDDIYNQWRNDPAKIARLTLFLLDNEEYDNQASKKKLVEDKLNNASKLGVIRLGKRAIVKEEVNNQNKSGRIDLSTIN